ncbi:MAG: glycosyltransferase family 4 protein [Thomasclavelia sp.]
MKKALELASVASMIDLFNMDNIEILKELGYQVDVACNFDFGSITSDDRVGEFKAELINDGIGVYNIPIPRSIFKINKIVKSYKMVKQLCKKNEYKIIHCHSPIGGVIARLAVRKFRKKGTRVVYTAHGFHFYDGAPLRNWLIFYPIEKFCSKFTDCIITINHEDYNRAKKKFHAGLVKYVPGIGVHVDEIQNQKVDKIKLKKKLGLNEIDFVIMSIGQISTRKNQKCIIEALSYIKNENIKYVIVGFGELELELKDLVKKLKLENRVIFAGYRKDAKALLHCADLFAFPSLQEGLPASLMEAMAVGLPVIASKIRGNSDLIMNGKNGFLYDCYDVRAFSQGIEKIYENKKLQKNMRNQNLSVIKNFDYIKVQKIMKKLFNEVIK